MKKTLVILLCTALCLCAAACGGKRDGAPDESWPDDINENEKVYEISDDDMAPSFTAGDRIVCMKVVDFSSLSVGDIITFYTVKDGRRVLDTSRIYNIYEDGGSYIYETKGDKNTSPDLLTVHQNEIVGRFIYKIEE